MSSPSSPVTLPQTGSLDFNHSVALLAKRNRLLTAWKELAPNDRFGDMTLAQFQLQTLPSGEARNALADSRARISSLITQRNDLAAALNTLLKRVANAVCSDARFGDNSPLYRAMGFVPLDERKFRRPGATTAAELLNATEPRFQESITSRKRGSLLERYQRIAAAWEQSAVDTLNGITLEELRRCATAWLETLQGRILENSSLSALVGLKKTCDTTTRALMKRVVAGVIGSSRHGENSALYRAMGYIPTNQRRRPQSPTATFSTIRSSPTAPVHREGEGKSSSQGSLRSDEQLERDSSLPSPPPAPEFNRLQAMATQEGSLLIQGLFPALQPPSATQANEKRACFVPFSLTPFPYPMKTGFSTGSA